MQGSRIKFVWIALALALWCSSCRQKGQSVMENPCCEKIQNSIDSISLYVTDSNTYYSIDFVSELEVVPLIDEIIQSIEDDYIHKSDEHFILHNILDGDGPMRILGLKLIEIESYLKENEINNKFVSDFKHIGSWVLSTGNTVSWFYDDLHCLKALILELELSIKKGSELPISMG